MIRIAGISACSTVRKARKWLDGQGLEHEFLDYNKAPNRTAEFKALLAHPGRDAILNPKSARFKELTDDQKAKASTNDQAALELMLEIPQVLKRPILITETGEFVFGFKEDEWSKALNRA